MQMITLKENKDRRNEMLSARRILAISPHPDDSEIIAGGFLFKAVNGSASVRLLVVTDGAKGTRKKGENLAEKRKMEQLKSAGILGIGDVKFLGIGDTYTPSPRQLLDLLLPEMRDFSPDLVITNDPFLRYEVHPDHINVGLAVMQSVLFFEFPNIGNGEVKSKAPSLALSPSDEPNVFINIDNEFEVKLNALKEHRSQNLDLNWITDLSKYYGKYANSVHAEAFRYLYPHELHLSIHHE
ncbi:MAG: PIG-L deacetylase family protein [Thermoplasmata archaeon]|nr:hypothetical protein [Euryarchaeota archaeon]